MALARLAVKNIVRSLFRSSVVLLCALFVSACILVFSIILRNAEAGLSESIKRLGADFIVNPAGGLTQQQDLKEVRLMSILSSNYMPREVTEQILAVEGVERVSPQLYLLTERDVPHSTRKILHVVAMDPATDFTLNPWAIRVWDRAPEPGQAVAGANLTWQVGEKASLMGYEFTVSNRLEPTGTEVDQTLFMPYETAREFIQAAGLDLGYDPAYIPNRSSGILVRVDRRSHTEDVFDRVVQTVERVRLLRSTDMLQAQRNQLVGLLWTGIWLLALVTLLSMVIVGLVFSLTINERRPELGVLKAIGFTRQAIIQTILYEGGLLAVVGGIAGVLLAVAGVLLLGGTLQNVLGMAISLPPWQEIGRTSLAGLGFALVSIALATLYPALRITGQETALIMRE